MKSWNTDRLCLALREEDPPAFGVPPKAPDVHPDRLNIVGQRILGDAAPSLSDRTCSLAVPAAHMKVLGLSESLTKSGAMKLVFSDTNKEAGFVHEIVSDTSALRAKCSSHEKCSCVINTRNGEVNALQPLVRWIHSGRSCDPTQHSREAWDLKESFGMAPRGKRP